MPHPIPPRIHARGFTAIELMVVVAIMAILTALAAPSFTPIIERWRVRQAVEGLQSTLYYARSEAIKRGGNVIIQKNTNDATCTASGGADSWDCGWHVWVDANGDGTFQSSELLQRFNTPAKVQVTRSSSQASIKLNRWGLTTGPFVGFSLVPQSKGVSDPAARGVCMSSGGRIRVIPPDEIPCKG
ncbi:GspH/FimT family pseudopilin [Paenacidovorax monticola]|nr:GspH/FimT family pseudopilin [Paenacidovorax monticola]